MKKPKLIDLYSDTGEHIENDKHELQYTPFPICNETGKPLELQYGVEAGIFPQDSSDSELTGYQNSTAQSP